jgi:hypothetical protein
MPHIRALENPQSISNACSNVSKKDDNDDDDDDGMQAMKCILYNYFCKP